jgi:glycosyltransferase involved in cell wall biosynthesis
VKVAVVVQRYGADIGGGAELHARYLAERLSRHVDVRVLTTCARDYVSWRNHWPPGEDRVNGVAVERFPVAHERDITEFGRLSTQVFSTRHSLRDELRWLDAEGPTSPALIERLRGSGDEFDYVLLFSIRYYHAYHGARAVAARAILVPTAEREAALGLSMFGPVFRGVRAIMYNSFEERAVIQAVSGNHGVPGVVVGVGSEIPAQTDPARFRRAFGVEGPFAIYVGRIDANKGCGELFDFFIQYADNAARPVSLLLIGTPVLPVPQHPRIRHLGYVSDQDKFDAMAAADLLIVPSYFESLSMVALEAWALGRPVLANAHCDVLLGQCMRSNAGLYYRDAAEFAAALEAIVGDRSLAAMLGNNGRAYYERHYSWPVIERKYLSMFARLDAELAAGAAGRQIEALPGWWERRRATLPPATEVLAAVPAGPAPGDRQRRGEYA